MILPQVVSQTAARFEQEAGHIVNGYHVGLAHQERHAVDGDVIEVGRDLSQESGECQVVGGIGIRSAVGGDLEILRKCGELGKVRRRNYQRVLIVRVGCAQGLDQVANVGTDAEIFDPADVDGDV